MAATEIEKLERRYAENPQGLTFAPLAEVHRKNGEVTRALELLRAGLELHPNYIPASIVLGRCHWDLGDLPAAEAAFAHVLRLDDENVIALKSLADINERLERFGEAQRWLNRLISVDRSNEEARQQLARIETSKQKPAAPVSASRPEPEAAPPAEAKPAALPERISEITAVAPLAPVVQTAEPAPAPEPVNLDLTADLAEGKPAELEFIDTAPAPEPMSEPEPIAEPEPPVQAEPAVASSASSPPEEPAPVAGLISQEFVPPRDGAYKLHPELTQDLVPPESASGDELEVETAEAVELHSSGASEFRVPNAAEEFMDAVSARPARPPELELPEFPAYELPPEPESRPKPEAPVESQVPQAPPPGPQPRPAPVVPQLKETPRSYSVIETKGQSVGAFFQRLLSARPAGSTAPVPPVEEPSPHPSPPADASVSFDDFFGTAASPSGSSPAAKQDADPSKDDLDQFQSWLQNLKR
jgi:hypothetical protein